METNDADEWKIWMLIDNSEDIFQYALDDQIDIYWYSDHSIQVQLDFDKETTQQINGSDSWKTLIHGYIALPKNVLRILMSGRDALLDNTDAIKSGAVAPNELVLAAKHCFVLDPTIKVLKTDKLFVKESELTTLLAKVTTQENSISNNSSTMDRREIRKMGTQTMHANWQIEYRKLKKENITKSDTWISKQIARMDIAKGRDSETIRRNMKN